MEQIILRETYQDCPQCDGAMLVIEFASGYVWGKCESCAAEFDEAPKEE